MTIKHRGNIQNIAQKEKVSIFKEKNGALGGAQKQQLQQKLDLSKDDRQSHKEQANDVEKITCGGNQRLLMLAHSAELVLESEDSCNRGNGNSGTSGEQHQDWIENVSDAAAADPVCVVEKRIDGMTAIDQVVSERVGCHWKGRTPRLTQIKCLARLKDELPVQQKPGEFENEHLGGRVRLTQIRCLARLKSQLVQDTSQVRTEKCSHGNSQGRTVRLSKMKRRARSKSSSLVQEAIEDPPHMCLDSQKSQDNQTRKIIAEIFGEEESFEEVNAMQL